MAIHSGLEQHLINQRQCFPTQPWPEPCSAQALWGEDLLLMNECEGPSTAFWWRLMRCATGFVTDTGHGDIWALLVHFCVRRPCVSDIMRSAGRATRHPVVAGKSRLGIWLERRKDWGTSVGQVGGSAEQQVNISSQQVAGSHW